MLLLWIYEFKTTNSEIGIFNKTLEDSKTNLGRIKEIKYVLPEYLQFRNKKDVDNKIRIKNATNRNQILAIAAAKDPNSADKLGRGNTQPVQWYDEFAYLDYNDIIYLASAPAQSQASIEASNNKKPNFKLISTTAGDLNAAKGEFSFDFVKKSATFHENIYDMKKNEIEEYLEKNSLNNFFYVEYNYKQLGRSHKWFLKQCRELNMDKARIKREVLNEWIRSSSLSPFSEDDIDRIKTHIIDPIGQIQVNKFFNIDFYKHFDWRQKLLLGCDVGGGIFQNNSAFVVVNPLDLSVVADFSNNVIDTVEFTELIFKIMTEYFPNSVLFIERNSYGKNIIDLLLKTEVADRIYYEDKKIQAEKKIRNDSAQFRRESIETRVYGITTERNSRSLMIDLLSNIVYDDYDKISSRKIVDEIAGLERKANGKIEHSNTSTDDSIFSYLMVRYAWTYGENLARFNIHKQSIISDNTDEEKQKELIAKETKLIKNMLAQNKISTSSYLSESLKENNIMISRSNEIQDMLRESIDIKIREKFKEDNMEDFEKDFGLTSYRKIRNIIKQ